MKIKFKDIEIEIPNGSHFKIVDGNLVINPNEDNSKDILRSTSNIRWKSFDECRMDEYNKKSENDKLYVEIEKLISKIVNLTHKLFMYEEIQRKHFLVRWLIKKYM